MVTALPVVAVFGANASGKTNLVSALRDMRSAVRTSFADWPKSPGVPRKPFKLDRESSEETSLYEVDLTLGRKPVRFTYGFELSDDRVEARGCTPTPTGSGRSGWTGRPTGLSRKAASSSSKATVSSAERDALVSFTRSDALFLSTAATANDKQLSALYRWFLDNLWLMTPGEDVVHRTKWTQELLGEPGRRSDYAERILQLLSVADLGVTGIEIDRETQEIRLRHRTTEGQDVSLDFLTEESFGTHAWFAFLGPMLTLLDKGAVLLVDELIRASTPRWPPRSSGSSRTRRRILVTLN
ncbi:ATPase AAA-type core domain-containing protein OS=Streptomyces microflavus OX=1919 GN=Smic_59110 PE=4 SV=1 [Streptomyces microflavus]